MLIFRGFFDQIPRELLESARVDGCAERKVLAKIVVPLTRPLLLTGAILVTINVWGDYLWPSIVIQDPHRTTISAGVQQFVGSFGLDLSGGGSVFAAFVIATMPLFVLVGFTMRHFVSGLTEGARNCDQPPAAGQPPGLRPVCAAPTWSTRSPSPPTASGSAGGSRARPGQAAIPGPGERGGAGHRPARPPGTPGASVARLRGIAYDGTNLDRGPPVRVAGPGVGRGRAGLGLGEPASFEVELDPAGTGGRPGSAWARSGRASRAPVRTGPPDRSPTPCARRPTCGGRSTSASRCRSARLYITALGLYEARLNGRRVGDAYLAPGWTDYGKRVHYQAYDVTGLLAEGENVLGAIIADGWYSGFIGFDAKRAGAQYGQAPELLAQLAITLADGSEQWVATDEHWRASFAAIRHADLLMGERHDLRLSRTAGTHPDFDAASFDGRSGSGRSAAGGSAGAACWPTLARRSGSPRSSRRSASPGAARPTSSTSART